MAKVYVRDGFFRERVAFTCVGPSLTKQSHKEECDVNTILRKYYKTGLITHVAKYKGDYSDLPDAMDLQDAMDIQFQAEGAFSSLPSKVRSRFENEPRLFLEFALNPANKAGMEELGLGKLPARVVIGEPVVAAAPPVTEVVKA